MLRFFRESVKEFDHVVWPTRKETVRYFTIVLSTITVFTVFLFIIGTVFSTSLFSARSAIRPTTAASLPASPATQAVPDIDLKALQTELAATGAAK
ncbi:MAG: Preprotein translocase subunit SecE [Patescibacteria group bacterium]|nr:Preprotein translocase subunit SecE [Patescibacteria group bacterium]